MAYIPVWLNGKCYIGTIFSHHGAYRHGVDAEITLSSPREDEEVIGDYLISGLRHVIAITSGWKSREAITACSEVKPKRAFERRIAAKISNR